MIIYEKNHEFCCSFCISYYLITATSAYYCGDQKLFIHLGRKSCAFTLSILCTDAAYDLLSSTAINRFLLTPLFKSLLHLSPITFFVMFLSMISGNPSGSKMARDYYDQHLISAKEMEGLMYFCNLQSPLHPRNGRRRAVSIHHDWLLIINSASFRINCCLYLLLSFTSLQRNNSPSHRSISKSIIFCYFD